MGAKSTQAPTHLGLDPRGRSWDAQWISEDPEPGERRCEEKSQHLWKEKKKRGEPPNQTPRLRNLEISPKHKENPKRSLSRVDPLLSLLHSLGSYIRPVFHPIT